MKKRQLKIALVTGTRAEYGIWRPVLAAIEGTRGLRLQLVVTGMHLLEGFGKTVEQIKADGWAIAARVLMYGGKESVGQSLARGTAALDEAFTKLKPDVVLVLGDRVEMLAAAQAAMCQGRIIGHLHGGETAPGQMDEQIRHAITKMAHLHFCSTEAAGRRIVQMGENPGCVHPVGAPAIDELVRFFQHKEHKDGTKSTKKQESGLEPLLVLHPTSRNDKAEYTRARMVIRALLPFCRGRLRVIGPNNDPGHEGILRAYDSRRQDLSLAMSLSQDEFWREAVQCGVLVGNSSSGIIEMATLGVPVVNIGPRQAGRERSGNVLDVEFRSGAITAALQRALSDRAWRQRVARRKNIYGDGHSAGRITRILADISPDAFPRIKHFHDS